jgi:cysteine synthase A
MNLGPEDVVMTVATDGAEMYETELARAERRLAGRRFDEPAAAETFGRWLLGAATDNMIELGHRDRNRVFNLGYYTWVEQQGVALADFDARRDQAFWDGLMYWVEVWDDMIENFNAA